MLESLWEILKKIVAFFKIGHVESVSRNEKSGQGQFLESSPRPRIPANALSMVESKECDGTAGPRNRMRSGGVRLSMVPVSTEKLDSEFEKY